MTGSIHNLVVAMDNSEFSLTAARWGAHLAAATGASVTLVHVVDVRYIDGPWFADVSGALGAAPYEQVVQKLNDAMTERGTNILTIGTEICRKLGVEPTTLIRKGLFVDVMRELTEEANLLVLGRRGDDFSTGSHFLGTAGERAIRQVACSCLVVPDSFTPPTHAIVGINDSGPARSARRWAEYLHATFPDLTVDPVHVRQPDDSTDYAAETVAGQPVRVLDGDPEGLLIEACAGSPEDTICLIGATGHTRTLRELILGTLTFHLLHKLKSPVLIAR